MDKLLELLGQELYNQVITKLGDNSVIVHAKDEKYVLDDGNNIPKHRLDEVISQKNALSEQITSYKQQLTDLKKSAEGNDALIKQIEDLQKANKDAEAAFQTKEVEIKKSFALKEALLNAGVADSEARELLLGKFKLDTVQLTEDGKIKDFDSLIKPIKENKTLQALFGETKIKGTERKDDLKINGTDLLTFEQIQGMSQSQVDANIDLVNKSLASLS